MRFPERQLYLQGGKLLFIILLMLALSSCFLFNSPIRQGSILISVTSEYLARDLQPSINDITIKSYQISGIGPNGQILESITTTSMPFTLDNLIIGEWTITVEGINSSESPVVLASATQTLSIHPNKETKTIFALALLEGKGSLALTVRWPVAVSIDEIRGTWTSADKQKTGTFTWAIPTDISQIDGYVTYQNRNSDISTGLNSIIFTYYFNGLSKGPQIAETAVIYKDITTTATLEIPYDRSKPVNPVFSPISGTYENPQTVSITSSTPNATIYYTTDGSEPGVLSQKYTSPLYISSNVVVKAITLSSAKLVSDVTSSEYRILKNTSQGSGTALIRYGPKLYILGGKDSNGIPLKTVRSSTLDNSNGIAGILSLDLSLPEGIAHGSAFAAGSIVYLLGGETPGGISDAIYYSQIKKDGSFKFWVENSRPLPRPRTQAAVVFHNGWVYLIGGDTDQGPTDTIIRARIYHDGQIGYWYPSTINLPKKLRASSATILEDRLFIVGGVSESTIEKNVYSYKIGAQGHLDDLRVEAELPQPLSNSILIPNGNDLLVIGGYSTASIFSNMLRYSSGSWVVDDSVTIDSESSSFGIAAGKLFFLPKNFNNDTNVSVPQHYSGISLVPTAPEVMPGSGKVPDGVSIKMKVEPGTDLRYTIDGSSVSSTSRIYIPIATEDITKTNLQLPRASITSVPPVSTVIFKAYNKTNGSQSVEIRYDYRFDNESLPMRAGSLYSHEKGVSIFDTVNLREETTDIINFPSGYQPTYKSLYYVHVSKTGYYRLYWIDADSSSTYTARITLTFFEPDLFTEVPAIETGKPIAALSATTDSPLRAYLTKGTYSLLLKDKNQAKGGNFGFLLVEE